MKLASRVSPCAIYWNAFCKSTKGMKTTTAFIFFISLVPYFLWAGTSSAGGELIADSSVAFNEAMTKTLSLDHRPSITEIKSIFGPLLKSQDISPESVAGFQSGGLGTKDVSRTQGYGELQKVFFNNPSLAAIALDGPEVIATFEKVYPGATYVGLGRDSAFLVDLMDAFYQSLGQANRVEIAEVGRDSFKDTPLLIQYFEQLGLNLKTEVGVPSFVPFDATNFRESSQSTQLLKAIIETCASRPGCDKEILLKRLGFINTGPNRSMYQKNIITPDFAFETVIQSQIDLERYSGILSYAASQPLIYTPEYHDSYKGLEKTQNNRVIPIRGNVYEVETRRQIILSQILLIRIVESEEFHLRVREVAKNLYNFDFPDRRVENEKEIEDIRGYVIKVPLKNILGNLSNYLDKNLQVELSNIAVEHNQKLLQDLFTRIHLFLGDEVEEQVLVQLRDSLNTLIPQSKVSIKSLVGAIGSLGENAGSLLPLFTELLRLPVHENQVIQHKKDVQVLIQKVSAALQGNSEFISVFRNELKSLEQSGFLGVDDIAAYLMLGTPDPNTYSSKLKFDYLHDQWSFFSDGWSEEKEVIHHYGE